MSISVAVLPEPGAPQVGVTVTGLSSPATISIQRSWKGSEWWSVIGAVEVEAFGSYFTRDFLPPLNVPVTYRVVVHAGTVTGDDHSAPLTVASQWAWLQDPRDPRGACAITIRPELEGNMLGMGAFASATYEQQADLVTPLGARLPVGSFAQRVAGAQIPVVLHRELALEGGELQRLMMDAGELVLRGAPTGLVDAVATIAAQDVGEQVVGAPGHQVSTWTATIRQVRSSVLRVVIPWWTYSQCAEMWVGSSYADAYAAKPGLTYLDWQADPAQP